MYPKFIITTSNHFRLGMVNLHKDLLEPGEECLGGGFYAFDFTSNRLLLHGASYDFGAPRWHLLDRLVLPAAYRGLRLVYQSDDTREPEFYPMDALEVVYEEA